MNLSIPRERAAQIRAELETIHRSAGDRALNTTEQRQWDELEAEETEISDALRSAEETERKMAAVTASRAKWNSVQVNPTNLGGSSSYTPTDVARMGNTESRDAAHRILDDQRRSSAHLAPAQGDHVDALLRSTERGVDGDKVARLILLTETPTYRSAFMRVITDPHPVLTGAEADALRAVEAYRAASLTDASGGYGVPALVDPTIILTGQGSGNPFWKLATVKTITNDVWKGVSSAGVSWSWDDEAEEVSDDWPTLDQPVVPLHTCRGFVPYSMEIGQDYYGFAGEIATLLAEGYSELTAQAFAVGAGTTEPKGILTALDAVSGVEVTPTVDGAFSAADIDKLWTALPDRAKGNATWLMNSQVNSKIAGWGDAYGGRTVDLTGVPTTLRQRPIQESSYMPVFSGSTGTANIAIVGDFRRFIIAQRAGMSVEPVPHLFGANNRPTGQRGMFAWARVGSDVSDATAFRLLQNQ